MTHEEIKILISAYIDHEVTPPEKGIVEEHLKTCSSCQNDLKMYKSMSSSLSKWSDESLSPDAAIKVNKRIEQRREPMFTQRNLMALGTTLALTIIVGSVFYQHQGMRYQSRIKSASTDVADEYSVGNLSEKKQYEPYYMVSNYPSKDGVLESDSLKQGQGLVMAESSQKSFGFESQKVMANGNFISPRASSGLVGMDADENKPVGGANYYQNASMPSSYYDAGSVDDRKKIQRADINLKVDNAFQTKAQLTDLIIQSNGFILSSEFDRLNYGSGRGSMVCKIYPKDLEHVLEQIRKLGEVENENETSSDVTDQFNDTQDNISKYSTEKIRLEKTLNNFKLFNPTTDEERDNTQRQIAQTAERIKALEHVIKYYERQTSMSEIVVNYYDNYRNTIKEKDNNGHLKNILKNKWRKTWESSVEIFSNILFGIIFLLSYIVPVLIWVVIFTVIYFIVRLFFKK